MSERSLPGDAACVLAVSAGSSSIRFALYDVTQPLLRRLRGKIERIGLSGTTLTVDDSTGTRVQSRAIDARGHSGAASALIDWLDAARLLSAIKAVGHRVVHGVKHSEPERVTPKLLGELHRITPYAPDHLPREIGLIEAFLRRHPKLAQVACFDTAFHRTIAASRHVAAHPAALYGKGRRALRLPRPVLRRAADSATK